jgi:hypothetical protein
MNTFSEKKKKKIGKGAVSHNYIYSYCTAHCVVICFGCYEKPSSKINKIFTQTKPTATHLIVKFYILCDYSLQQKKLKEALFWKKYGIGCQCYTTVFKRFLKKTNVSF